MKRFTLTHIVFTALITISVAALILRCLGLSIRYVGPY